jgi:hypothetical protein
MKKPQLTNKKELTKMELTKKGPMNKMQEKINDYMKKLLKANDEHEAQNITYDYDLEVLPQEEYDKIEQFMKENK